MVKTVPSGKEAALLRQECEQYRSHTAVKQSWYRDSSDTQDRRANFAAYGVRVLLDGFESGIRQDQDVSDHPYIALQRNRVSLESCQGRFGRADVVEPFVCLDDLSILCFWSFDESHIKLICKLLGSKRLWRFARS